MTWCTLVITPLVMVLHQLGSPAKENLLWLEWLVDISWSVEIVLNFFTVDDKARTLKARAHAYFWSYFWFDVAATVPPIVTGQ